MIWSQPGKAFCSEGTELAKAVRWESAWPFCRGDRILVWMRNEPCLMVAQIRLGLLHTNFHSDYIAVVYVVNYKGFSQNRWYLWFKSITAYCICMGGGVGIGREGENSHYLDQRPEDSYWKMIKKWLMFTKYFALFQASYICSLVLPTTCEIGALSFRVYRWGNGGKATIWQGWNLNAVSVVLRAVPLTARPCSHSRLSSPICVSHHPWATLAAVSREQTAAQLWFLPLCLTPWMTWSPSSAVRRVL